MNARIRIIINCHMMICEFFSAWNDVLSSTPLLEHEWITSSPGFLEFTYFKTAFYGKGNAFCIADYS